jgi:TolA-binding protein
MNVFAKTVITGILVAGTTVAARAAKEPHFLVHRGSQNVDVIYAAEWDPPQATRDPGYQLYRDGYRLILAEQWGEARKKFSELLRRYPHSRYLEIQRPKKGAGRVCPLHEGIPFKQLL